MLNHTLAYRALPQSTVTRCQASVWLTLPWKIKRTFHHPRLTCHQFCPNISQCLFGLERSWLVTRDSTQEELITLFNLLLPVSILDTMWCLEIFYNSNDDILL